MAELVWSEPAKKDLLNIIDYISEDNPIAAINLVEDIDRKVNHLIDFPESGRKGRVNGTRELVALSNYIVVYRINSNAIHVLRLLHAAQQWP